MTRAEITKMLVDIKSVYQNFVLNENVAEAWVYIFKDYEKDPIIASFNKYVRTNEYPPVPASIIKIYNEGKAKLDHSVGRDYTIVMELLTEMIGGDVFEEVDYYRQWTLTIPEMYRMQSSSKMVNRLKEERDRSIGCKFDFKKWLDREKDVI